MLVDDVMEYVNADDDCGAMAIVGEWGLGKTYYIESVIRKRLEEEGKRLVRVSLYGLDNASSLYEHIACALLQEASVLSGIGKRNGRKHSRYGLGAERVNDAISAVSVGAVSKVLQSGGMSYQLTSKMLITLLATKDVLLVLDDAERKSEVAGDHEIFGVVNELVENQGIKAIIVARDLDHVNEQVREKTIGSIRHYEPDIDGLVRSIFGEYDPYAFGSLYCETIVEAVAFSGCTNARAMKKARHFIALLFDAADKCASSYAEQNLRLGLVDLIGLTLLVASGNEPVSPDGDEKDFLSEEYINQVNVLSKYEDCPIIREAFVCNKPYTQEDVSSAFVEYMDANYPDSGETKMLLDAIEAITPLWRLSEAQAVSGIENFNNVVRRKAFDPRDICKVISMHSYISKAGFEEEMSSSEFKECIKSVIDKNPERAYKAFHSQFEAFGSDAFEEWRQFESEMDDYATTAYRMHLQDEIKRNERDGENNFVAEVVVKLRDLKGEDASNVRHISPSLIIEAFAEAAPKEQLDLGRILRELTMYAFSDERREVLEWSKELREGFESLEVNDKTDNLRKGFVLEALNKLVGQLDERD